ncbi:MAG: diaminopimelate decarboxylase [Elusimicrobia bacterium]|nr:diaminopimelate decarboxylase [Elusimicrobiota bacterium]
MSTSAPSSNAPGAVAPPPAEIRFHQGRLLVESVPVEAVARAVGTPVYIYSAGAVLARLRELEGAFAGRDPLVCYALKANPNRAVCGLLARAGAGAEVVSGGELRRALAAGFSPRKIVFSGVGKTEEEIRFGLRSRLLAQNVESEEELNRTIAVARRLRLRAPISIRLNPGVEAGGHRHLATGHGAAKFGVAPADALRLCLRARREPSLELKGLHCHIGSQILDPRPFVAALGVVERLLGRLRAAGVRLSLVDVGGGLGVRYEDESRGPAAQTLGPARARLQPAALAKALAPFLSRWPDLGLVLEPGRFLTAEAGLLATRILYRKRIGTSRFLIVDAAMNDLLRPALYSAYHPVVPARLRDVDEVVCDVVGPVCETGDVLARRRRLPWLPAGELLAVLKTGAYGFSMASQYNSRPRPAEVLVEGGRWRVVRERESYRDLVRHER